MTDLIDPLPGGHELEAAIVEMAADAIVSIDEDRRIILFNKSAEILFGYDREEVHGQILEFLIPERYRADHPQYVRDFAASPVLIHSPGHQRPVPGLRKDGSEFIAEISFSKVRIGGELYLTAILHDVTERERLDEDREFLAESSRVLTAGLEFGERAQRLAQLVVPRLADWCIIDLLVGDRIERAAVAHHDPEREDALRATQEFAPLIEKAVGVRRAIETGETELVEEVDEEWIRAATLNDEHYHLISEQEPRSIMIVPLITGGRAIGTMLLATTTESGRTYSPVDLGLAQEFAGVAALHINNARLYRESVEASRIRDQVLRIVAHDLRNPLHTISLSSGLLRDLGAFDPESQGASALDLIDSAVERADRLIQELLDVARIESGGLSLATEVGEMRPILEQVTMLQRPLAEEKGISLYLEAPAELPPVVVDRDRILQVFENLIGNAVKFTESGGEIWVRAQEDGAEIRFTITDTGVGIAEKDLPYLFSPFWQALTGDEDGSGLGLAIARGIVEAHGGQIWAESSEGQGSTFTFTLPISTQS